MYSEGLVPLEHMARPSLGLAGLRVDPANATLAGQTFYTQITLVAMDTPAIRLDIVPPTDALIMNAFFSPDGKYLAFTLVRSDRIDLAVAAVEDGVVHELASAGPLNGIWGSPCAWVSNERLLCRKRGQRAVPPASGIGPKAEELVSGFAPVRSRVNLLRDANDDALFEYHGAVELVFVSLENEAVAVPIEPGLLPRHQLSPDGEYLVIERLKAPYPRIVAADRFPRDVDIHRTETGERLHSLHVGTTTTVKTRGLEEGPRLFRWAPDESAKLVYVERGTGRAGNVFDVIHEIKAPFDQRPKQRSSRFVDIESLEFTTEGKLLVFDRGVNNKRKIIYYDERPRLMAELDADLMRARNVLRADGDRGAILESRDRIFLAGDTGSAVGTRQTIEEVNLESAVHKRYFTSEAGVHEQPLALLNARRGDILLISQSPVHPPSLVLMRDGKRHAVTQPEPMHELLQGIERRVITFRRTDGVKLSANLYLPAGHQPGQPLPVVFWIYPREFSTIGEAAMAFESNSEYFDLRGPSRFIFLRRGYALVDGPFMPIIGSRLSAQDDYVPQLILNAEAAIDYLVAAGIADRQRLAVVGRSYGAFAVANLMAHSTLFRAGIAMSGAYNRTLTPFGFQNESRSFWQRQEAYIGMSPFFFADRVANPILLIHGEQDENPGTPTMQSEGFFAALVGNGVPSRYVSLPFEGHQYRARESVMHVAAEMLSWVDRHVMGHGE
jgi:dipeptidyl aminopeptidase/acylaminoacyl peptidase